MCWQRWHAACETVKPSNSGEVGAGQRCVGALPQTVETRSRVLCGRILSGRRQRRSEAVERARIIRICSERLSKRRDRCRAVAAAKLEKPQRFAGGDQRDQLAGVASGLIFAGLRDQTLRFAVSPFRFGDAGKEKLRQVSVLNIPRKVSGSRGGFGRVV